mgnify:CR=1 FL=1
MKLMSNLMNDLLHLNVKKCHLMTLSLVMVFACLFGSCGDDDDKLLNEPETPVNPGDDTEDDNPEVPDAKGTALFFDVDGTTNFQPEWKRRRILQYLKIERRKKRISN